MIVPYAARLVCLCLASFFLLHLALTALALALAPWAVRRAARMGAERSARSAAMLLLGLRLLPAALSVAVVASLCLPSFVSFESERGAEFAGIPFLAAALLGASIWAISIGRGVRAVIRAHRWARLSPATLPGESEAVWMCDGATPFIGLAGVLQPRVVVSRNVAGALDRDQLAAALRHERAHRASADNFKRLLLLLTPEALPGISLFRAVDRAWARFGEWAADDRAVGRDEQSSISLAEALVRVARLGAAPRTSPLVSAFVPAGEDISVRVDRLLNGRPGVVAQSGVWGRTVFAGLVATPFVAALAVPGSLATIHGLLERMMH
jgi:Zn-dependent protease with chaperone function